MWEILRLYMPINFIFYFSLSQSLNCLLFAPSVEHLLTSSQSGDTVKVRGPKFRWGRKWEDSVCSIEHHQLMLRRGRSSVLLATRERLCCSSDPQWPRWPVTTSSCWFWLLCNFYFPRFTAVTAAATFTSTLINYGFKFLARCLLWGCCRFVKKAKPLVTETLTFNGVKSWVLSVSNRK